jgi:predicted DNA-binding mobile mystery protein A
MKPLDPLALSQIERRLKPLRKQAETTRLRSGWIHYIRTALGMSLKDLATRGKSSVSTVAQAEKREIEGKVTVETLRKMAAAMECEFIYAFVPREEIKTILKENARSKARRILAKANTHMTLEGQEVRQSMQERIERLAEKLMQDGDVW